MTKEKLDASVKRQCHARRVSLIKYFGRAKPKQPTVPIKQTIPAANLHSLLLFYDSIGLFALYAPHKREGLLVKTFPSLVLLVVNYSSVKFSSQYIFLTFFGMVSFTDQSVNMLDWFSKLTMEAILSTAFGVDTNIQMGENTETLEKAKALFEVPFMVRLIARLPLGKLLLKMMSSVRGNPATYLGDVVKEIIKTRRQQGSTGRKDLLHLMMTANEETTVEGVSRLSDEEIVAQSIIFLLAGYETSSNTLSFILYHLALNPDVQDKLRTEIKEAVESNAKRKSLYELAQSMEYLDCVLKESQRLCPAAAQVNRECCENYDLNGIHIPAGTEIMIPIYVLHHDPDAWQNPEKFDPERFRSPSKDARHAFQFLPFGAGPRNCIGMRFALMEVKIALVRILMKYKFVASPETQVPLEIREGITLSAKDGVLIRVQSTN